MKCKLFIPINTVLDEGDREVTKSFVAYAASPVFMLNDTKTALAVYDEELPEVDEEEEEEEVDED